MFALKRTSFIIAASLLLALAGACEKPLMTEPDRESDSSVTASFSLSKTAAIETGINRMVLNVTGQGMKTIMIDTLIAAEGQIRTELKIPAGKKRLFEVSLLRDSLKVLAGKDSLDLKAGQKAALNMTLHFLIPAISLTPVDTTLANNTTFTVFVKAHHVDSLCTIGTKLKFDPAKLQVVELGREDDFLKKNGGAVTQLQFNKDNTAGEVKLLLGVFPAAKSVSGEGKIARVVFKAINSTTAEIELSISGGDLGLYDQHANLMEAVALGSRITIQ